MAWIVYVPAGTGELLASSSPPLGSSRAHASPSPHARLARLRETCLSHGIPLVWNVGTPFGASNVFCSSEQIYKYLYHGQTFHA